MLSKHFVRPLNGNFFKINEFKIKIFDFFINKQNKNYYFRIFYRMPRGHSLTI